MMGARRRRIESILLSSSEPVVVYQPIVSTMTGELTGVEALSRFSLDPYRTPDVWFAEAAKVGLGSQLELHAVRRALEGLRDIPSGYLSLNFSAGTLATPELAQLVDEWSDVADRLVFEITEHDSIESYDVLVGVVDTLRSRGIRIAVDDAGAGYSSFAHILELKPDIIKLDRSVISGLHLDPVRRALVAAMADFASDIGASVVAEGVEEVEELFALRAAGVQQVQGYLCGRPGPLPVTPVSGLIKPPMRALVVDDDPVVRMIVSKVARRAGLEVVGEAHDGQQAITIATGTRPDVIILDLEMPVMDGLEALPLLRRAHPRSHIVVLSAHERPESRDSVIALGADLYMAKDDATTVLPQVLRRLESGLSGDGADGATTNKVR